MKALLFAVVAFFCIGFSAFSQTILKPTHLSTLTFHGSTLSLDDASVWASKTQQHFMLGWQWAGSNANTNKRLHCNF